MLEIMEFIFSSFWVWLGTVILVAVAGSPLNGLMRITIRRSTEGKGERCK